MTDQTSKPDAPKKSDPSQDTRTAERKLPENSKESLDRKLDEGIEESFPASDPVSVKITK